MAARALLRHGQALLLPQGPVRPSTRQICLQKRSALKFSEFGDPPAVLKLCEEQVEFNEAGSDVLVKMLAAPINPADINTIQGKYPEKPALPAVGGNEGVGEVVAVGAEVQNLSIGDRVVPLKNLLGTWTTHLTLPAKHVLKVPKDLGLVEAATLTVNPCTAFRMLRDFVDLKPGDVVLQNGANSACGQSVIQICRVWGLSSVNVVRDRPGIDELKGCLRRLGGTHVFTEEELRRTDVFKKGTVAKPKLALNCVGGQSSTELLRHLDHGGTMVTYGGMSRDPVTAPTAHFIFKDVRLRGFWMTRWSKKNADSVERMEMLEELIVMMTNGEMRASAHEMLPYGDFCKALGDVASLKGMLGKKFILDFRT